MTKKASPLEAGLAKIAAARSDETLRGPALREALASRKGLLIAPAAELIRSLELDEFPNELAEAFEALFDDPVKRDPMCKGKLAVVRALTAVGGGSAALFLKGARHVQKEPQYTEKGMVLEDTAAGLRGSAGLGLLRTRHPDGPIVVAELLADPELEARLLAAQALVELDGPSALPLLRYKLAVGDPSAEVVGACLGSVLDIDAPLGLTLARGLLGGENDEVVEAVALALGDTKRADAFPLLKDLAERSMRAVRATAYVAAALLRDSAATAWLLGVVKDGPEAHAKDAVKALAHFRHDPRIREPALAAAEGRKDSVRVMARGELERD